MIREAIAMLIAGRSLTQGEAAQVMGEIMGGEATPAQIAAFLTALRMKGETAEEIAGCALVMREKASRVVFGRPTIDTCGTGGDGLGTFNVSTTAAFVPAAAGIPVAKHGGRAASSHCGSADVLEALGVKIELTPEQVRQCLEQVGIGFMFAPAFHPAMKYAAPVRREIGVRTIFNILGPLTNPAGAQAQVLGVPEASLATLVAHSLQRLEIRHALVVHGEDGLDELSTCAPTLVYEVNRDGIQERRITPEELGLERAHHDHLRGGTATENAETLRRIFAGEKGPRRDIVLLNSAAALVVGGKAQSLKEGIALAAQLIDDGLAGRKVEELVEMSQSFTPSA